MKWMSNHHNVLLAFTIEERAPHIKDLDLKLNNFPLDRALGIHWDMKQDTICFWKRRTVIESKGSAVLDCNCVSPTWKR